MRNKCHNIYIYIKKTDAYNERSDTIQNISYNENRYLKKNGKCNAEIKTVTKMENIMRIKQEIRIIFQIKPLTKSVVLITASRPPCPPTTSQKIVR